MALLCALRPSGASAHDASAWGGLFRSRDGGATWFQASTGKIMGGALAVAVDPADPTHLLLGTDSGLLDSRNGGLDWVQVAGEVLVGPVLAVAFDSTGRDILAASASGLGRSEDGLHWVAVVAPAGAAPVRALMAGTEPGLLYLVGWQGLFGTADGGVTWSERDAGLDRQALTSVLVMSDRLIGIVDGEVWSNATVDRRWTLFSSRPPPAPVEALAGDPRRAERVWAAGGNQLFRSDDAGLTWLVIGQPLPDANTEVRGIAVDPTDSSDGIHLVLSTHRGLYSSHDGAQTWQLLSDNLPGHIEAGPLVPDQGQPATVYVGFSVTPYHELWQTAASGRPAMARLASSELAGAAALLLLVGLGAGLALQRLGRA